MDPETQINELKNALKTVIGLISERGQPVSPDMKLMLVRVMEHVATRIKELREAPIEAPQVPELEKSYPSSNVNAFAYDDKSGNLFVKFQGDYPQENGPVYKYSGVPKTLFSLFKSGAVPARTDGQNKWGKWWKGKVPSVGASLYTLIKGGGFPYQRLT